MTNQDLHPNHAIYDDIIYDDTDDEQEFYNDIDKIHKDNHDYDNEDIDKIRRDNDNDDDDYMDKIHNDDDDYDNEDLYGLLSIPGFGIICAILVFLWKRYRHRFLLGIINRFVDWIGGADSDDSLPNTTTTSANTTLVKTRMSDSDTTSFPISSIPTPSGSEIWNDRIYTDARRIYKHLREVKSSDLASSSELGRSNISQNSDQENIQYVDAEIQVSMDSMSDSHQLLTIEMLNMSDHVYCNEMDTSQDNILTETSFIQTRSGGRYDKDIKR